MNKLVQFVKHNIQELIVPALFFFIVFNLLAITKTAILEGRIVTAAGVGFAALGALILAKAIIIGDKLPFINLFHNKPLVLSILWKTLLYSLLGFIFMNMEELMPLFSKPEGFVAAALHFFSTVAWSQFLVLQIWLMVALILYNSVAEMNKHFGPGSMKKVFLG